MFEIQNMKLNRAAVMRQRLLASQIVFMAQGHRGTDFSKMASVPGAIATGSQRTARIEIARNCYPVAIAPGTDYITPTRVGTLTPVKLKTLDLVNQNLSLGAPVITLCSSLSKKPIGCGFFQ